MQLSKEFPEQTTITGNRQTLLLDMKIGGRQILAKEPILPVAGALYKTLYSNISVVHTESFYL